MTGVARDVGGCSGVTGGPSCRSGRRIIGITSGGVGGECGSARLAHRHLPTHPGTPCFEGFTRPVIRRVFFLEARKHMLGAVGSPEHQCPVVLPVKPLQFLSSIRHCSLPT